VESIWSISKLSTESVGSRRELVAIHTADADATKQFRRVGVGGVYWALLTTGCLQIGSSWIRTRLSWSGSARDARCKISVFHLCSLQQTLLLLSSMFECLEFLSRPTSASKNTSPMSARHAFTTYVDCDMIPVSDGRPTRSPLRRSFMSLWRPELTIATLFLLGLRRSSQTNFNDGSMLQLAFWHGPEHSTVAGCMPIYSGLMSRIASSMK